MKVHIEKNLLMDAINTVIRAVPGRTTIQALEGILFEAVWDKMTLTAYNLQFGVRAEYETEIEAEGRVVIDAKLLREIVSKLPEDTVTLDCADGENGKITCGNAEYNVSLLPAADYPELPNVEDAESLVIAENKLKAMIGGTAFSVSIDEARPAQMGVLFEAKDGILSAVACDGFRMAVRSETIGCADMSFLVPGTSLCDIERLLDDTDMDVRIAVGNNHVVFYIGSVEMVSRRLSGEFFAWRTAIPKNNPIMISVNARELCQSIERVSVVVNDKMKSPMRCVIGVDEIRISASTTLGTAKDRCGARGDGGGLEIGFNHRYLREALLHAPEDNLILMMNTEQTPTVITSTEEWNTDFLYMVLPVRLKKN